MALYRTSSGRYIPIVVDDNTSHEPIDISLDDDEVCLVDISCVTSDYRAISLRFPNGRGRHLSIVARGDYCRVEADPLLLFGGQVSAAQCEKNNPGDPTVRVIFDHY